MGMPSKQYADLPKKWMADSRHDTQAYDGNQPKTGADYACSTDAESDTGTASSRTIWLLSSDQ
jgi:hypothetical protein